jgi:predicted dehydrogenase
VNVEDCATILIRLSSGVQADIHMDFVQRTPSRSCVLAGDRAKLEWDNSQNEVRINRPDVLPEVIKYDFEPNEMYLAEMKDFFFRVSNRENANGSLKESELTLEVALAARASAAERKWVSFGK